MLKLECLSKFSHAIFCCRSIDQWALEANDLAEGGQLTESHSIADLIAFSESHSVERDSQGSCLVLFGSWFYSSTSSAISPQQQPPLLRYRGMHYVEWSTLLNIQDNQNGIPNYPLLWPLLVAVWLSFVVVRSLSSSSSYFDSQLRRTKTGFSMNCSCPCLRNYIFVAVIKGWRNFCLISIVVGRLISGD